jgi:DNA-binding NarL/FixJ family response regulator
MTQQDKPASSNENREIVPYNSSIVRRGLELISSIDPEGLRLAQYLAPLKSFSVLSANYSSLWSHYILRSISPWFPLKTLKEASNGIEALLEAEELNPSLILVTPTLISSTGMDLVKAIRAKKFPAKVILINIREDYWEDMTSSQEELMALEALASGVDEFLPLSWTPALLVNSIRKQFDLGPVRAELIPPLEWAPEKLADIVRRSFGSYSISPSPFDHPTEQIKASLIYSVSEVLDHIHTRAIPSCRVNDQEIALHYYYDDRTRDTTSEAKQISECPDLLSNLVIRPISKLILSRDNTLSPEIRLVIKVTIKLNDAATMDIFSWQISDIYKHKEVFLNGRMQSIQDLAEIQHLPRNA